MQTETSTFGGRSALGHWRKAVTLLLISLVSLPAFADRGKDAYSRGVKDERRSDYDAAFSDYKQAYLATPANPKYLSAYTRMRFNAAAQHIHTGQLLRNTGALAQALIEFQRAAAIDSTSVIAQQEIRRTGELMQRQERAKTAPKADRLLGKLPDDVGQTVELQPLSTAPLTLHFTATADVAYKTIGKLAGLNVVIDPDYKAQKISVDLTNVTLREALDLVRIESKSFWRPVLPNTILVAADSAGKRKELEQSIMRTFYLRNISTPAELQDAANVVKQILDVSHVQLLQAQDALVLRGTPDQLMLAEKVLNDIDKPKSEVIIDIAVMEVSRDRIRTIGTNVPTSINAGIIPNLGSVGTTSSGSSGGSAASSNGGFAIGSFVLSAPGASFSALSSDSNTKILQSPQIRVLNDAKATLRIGDRVPIATGSFQPGIVGGGSISPLVSTQFTYLDVGVNIDITPHIHADNEVTLKMALEISSVTGQQTIGGITQPIIGQRRIEHETRLSDGDVNLLGGILEDSETKSLSGYPYLSKIPILKYLFGQENKERQETEIVFAITPHIVRSLDVTDENLRAVEVGTGSLIELHHKTAATATDANASADPAKADPAKADPAKVEPAKAEPVKAEPAKTVPPAKLPAAPIAGAVLPAHSGREETQIARVQGH